MFASSSSSGLDLDNEYPVAFEQPGKRVPTVSLAERDEYRSTFHFRDNLLCPQEPINNRSRMSTVLEDIGAKKTVRTAFRLYQLEYYMFGVHMETTP